MKIKNVSLGLTLAALFILQGCGGGGGNSSSISASTPDPAVLSRDNVHDLGIAAASGAKQVVVTDSAPDLAPKGSVGTETLLQDIGVRIGKIASQRLKTTAAKAVAARLVDISTELCNGGGTATADIPDSSTETNFEFDAAFVDCTIVSVDGTVVVNGSMSVRYLETSSSITTTIAWNNLTLELLGSGVSEALNGSMTCTASDKVNLSDLTCILDFAGLDGRTYRVSDASFTGDASAGYSIDATVIDPDHGVITIATEVPILFDCPDGNPSLGSIVFSGVGGDTGRIDFLNCSSYQVSYNGEVQSFLW